MDKNLKKIWEYTSTLALLFGAIFLFTYFLSQYILKLPGIISTTVDIALTLTAIIIFFRLIKRLIYSGKIIKGDRTRQVAAYFLINILMYLSISLVVISAFDVNLTSLVTGSLFLTAILALAGQGVIMNILGALMIEYTKPMKEGEVIWLFPWSSSSPMLTAQLAVISQKYYSKDILYSQGIVGKYMETTITYTTIIDSSGVVIKIPNSLIALGAYQIRRTFEMPFKLRYEFPKTVSIDLVKNVVAEEFSKMGIESDKIQNFVDETTLNTYVLRISVFVDSAEDHRTEIVSRLGRSLEKFRATLL